MKRTDNATLSRVFLIEKNEDTHEWGLRQKDRLDFSPGQGEQIAHDLIEHINDNENPILGEAVATGVAHAIRGSNPDWFSEHTPPANSFAADIIWHLTNYFTENGEVPSITDEQRVELLLSINEHRQDLPFDGEDSRLPNGDRLGDFINALFSEMEEYFEDDEPEVLASFLSIVYDCVLAYMYGYAMGVFVYEGEVYLMADLFYHTAKTVNEWLAEVELESYEGCEVKITLEKDTVSCEIECPAVDEGNLFHVFEDG